MNLTVIYTKDNSFVDKEEDARHGSISEDLIIDTKFFGEETFVTARTICFYTLVANRQTHKFNVGIRIIHNTNNDCALLKEAEIVDHLKNIATTCQLHYQERHNCVVELQDISMQLSTHNPEKKIPRKSAQLAKYLITRSKKNVKVNYDNWKTHAFATIQSLQRPKTEHVDVMINFFLCGDIIRVTMNNVMAGYYRGMLVQISRDGGNITDEHVQGLQQQIHPDTMIFGSYKLQSYVGDPQVSNLTCTLDFHRQTHAFERTRNGAWKDQARAIGSTQVAEMLSSMLAIGIITQHIGDLLPITCKQSLLFDLHDLD